MMSMIHTKVTDYITSVRNNQYQKNNYKCLLFGIKPVRELSIQYVPSTERRPRPI